MSAMNKVLDKLFLGNIKAASDLPNLKKNGITHVLQVASGIKPFFPNDLKYKVINILDNSNQSLLRHFPAAIAFIKDGMQRGGGVLIHCYAGVSRSSTCTIAFLMQEREMSFEDAFSYVSKRRPVIFPNMGFQRQLTEFERLLHVKRQFAVPNIISKQIMNQVNKGLTHNARNQAPPYKSPPKSSIVQELKKRSKKEYISTDKDSFQQSPVQASRNTHHQSKQEDEFEYDRLAHFERSASFGFNEDSLGRLNEINRDQMHEVLRGLNMRRTNSNFYRPQPPSKPSPGKHNQPRTQLNSKRAEGNKSDNRSSVVKLDMGKTGSLTQSTRKIEKYIPTETDSVHKISLNNSNHQTKRKNQNHDQSPAMNVREYRSNEAYSDPYNIQKAVNEGISKFNEKRTPNQNANYNQPILSKLGFLNVQTQSINKKMSTDSNTRPQTQNSKKQIYQMKNSKNSMTHLKTNVNENTPIKKKVKFQKRDNNRQQYECQLCGTYLFTNADLMDGHQAASINQNSSSSLSTNAHQSIMPMINGHRSTLTKCACLFLQLTDWIIRQGGRKNQSGYLYCINSACNQKLGQYSQNGLKCNCGQTVTPAYQIYKSKVKCGQGGGHDNTHYGTGQATMSLMNHTFHDNPARMTFGDKNDPFLNNSIRSNNFNGTKTSKSQGEKDQRIKVSRNEQKLDRVHNQVQNLINDQINKQNLPIYNSKGKSTNTAYINKGKNNSLFQGGQLAPISGSFDHEQTYVGMIGGKSREQDHIAVNSEGRIGKQGGRYLSVHRHQLENLHKRPPQQRNKQNILPPQINSNSGHVQMESMNTTPLQHHNKSSKLTGAGGQALINHQKQLFLKQNILKQQNQNLSNQMQINGVNYDSTQVSHGALLSRKQYK